MWHTSKYSIPAFNHVNIHDCVDKHLIEVDFKVDLCIVYMYTSLFKGASLVK